MTTAAHPKHSSRSPRRTKATILASVTAFIVLCVVLVNPFGIDKAYALNDGRDVTWNLDNGASGYSDMITAVSARVAGGLIYGSGDTQVDTTESNTNDYFSVDLTSPNIAHRPAHRAGTEPVRPGFLRSGAGNVLLLQ